MIVGLCDRNAFSLSLSLYTPTLTSESLNQSLWNMVCTISRHLSSSQRRVYAYPPVVARQQLGKNVTAATNTGAAIEKLFDA
jgi:hypothetical protein